MANLFVRKSIEQLVNESGSGETLAEHKSHFKRTLGIPELIMLGVGGTIGAGVFSLTGTAAASYAGPASVLSFLIGAFLCALAGLCYAEMASIVPASGSAYSYSYATLGEIIAWTVGWNLILEYSFTAVTVAISWSGYFVSLLTRTFHIVFPDFLLPWLKSPFETVMLSDGTTISGHWNVPASFITLVLTWILVKGIRESTKINNIIVVVKLTVLLIFIFIGWGVINPDLWIANPEATGLAALVPPELISIRNGAEFHSFGWKGVLTGAGITFFSYIGFDAVSTTAQECKNPSRDLPIGMLVSLSLCALIFVLIALVMTGIVPYRELGVPDPVAVGIDRIVSLRGWPTQFQFALSFLVKSGALAGLTSVILVMLLGQTRIFYAMAKDGLLPWLDQIHPRYSTPHWATITAGTLVSIFAGNLPLYLVGELVSMGTLFAFAIVCLGIPILRIRDPDLLRPFKVPCHWVVAPLGALSCFWVMWGLPKDSWIRLAVWMIVGVAIYFFYGFRHSRLRWRVPKT